MGHGNHTNLHELSGADYSKELRTPHRLTKYDVAEHLRKYVDKFHLNVILSAEVQHASYSPKAHKWTVKLKTTGKAGTRTRTVVSKHFLQTTGIGCSMPYIPPVEDAHLYKGLSLHSTEFRNARLLSEKGIKVRQVSAMSYISSLCSVYLPIPERAHSPRPLHHLTNIK